MKDLVKLRSLTEFKYQVSQNDLRRLIQEEQRLRSELRSISEQAKAVDRDTATRMGAIGADVVWHAWVGRMREQINLELAKVLAKKERHLANARREFSRVLVTRELVEKTQQAARKEGAKAQLRKSIETSLIVSGALTPPS